jgi:hypothetical protein
MQKSLLWFLVCLSLLLVSPAAAQSRWVQYFHPEFGTRIAYPADLLPRSTISETGAIFEGASAKLDVSARRLPEVATADAARQLMQGSPGYGNVTYSAGGKNWLVVSGYRGGDIFYEKYYFVRGTVQGFSFRYPTADQALYDSIVEAMENSFHPG